MLGKLFLSWGLMAVCVALHAAALAAVFRWIARSPRLKADRFWSFAWFLVQVAGCVIAVHLVEIAVWASFYVWKGILPDAESGFYFSAVTYTTVGYGDVVLPKGWRTFAAVEALTGILMCGWSAAFFFAAVSRIYAMKSDSKRDGPDGPQTTA